MYCDKSHYQQFTPPFDIPDSWEWVRLGDVCDVARGGSPRPIKSYLTYRVDGINWIKIGDTEKDGKFINSTKERIIPEGALKSRLVHKGDFLLTNSMSFGRPYILNIDGCIHDGWLVISPIGNVFDKDFLYLLLSSEYAYYQFSEKASGSAVSNLNSDKVAESIFPLPPLETQRIIVRECEKLTSFAQTIDNEKKDLEITIALTKSKILDLAMQGKLVPQDPADEPAADMLRRVNPKAKIITDNPHSWNIPNTWTWCQLGDIFQHNTGKALNSSNRDGIEYEYITTSNVYWNRFELDDLKKMPFKKNELEKCTVRHGDLLVCEGGDVGRAAIWNLDRNIMIQNHLHRLRPIANEIHIPLYYHVFRHYKDKDLIGGKGIALQGFSSKSLHQLAIPLPPYNEQKRIVAKIEELYSVLDQIEASLQS
ncbi:restriction endonuclease subunit S [Alistipes sp. Z76]|nr:restriction endonuclease subunit S [Alistipes sp. Z76]NCE70086.1 restriction endonuclease subunit S [Muribaculaceae bacterium M3]